MAGYNYNMNSYSYNDNLITAIIGSDGTIYQESMSNGRVKIGIDNQREKEIQDTIKDMQEILDNWRPKMIEHGYIEEEKTAEQILQEQGKQQAEINKALLEELKSLKNEVKEMKSNGDIGYGNSKSSSNVEQKPTGNQSGNSKSKKNNSGNDK